MAKLIVTAAPPTSNGDLHLGHISGPYLGADVFTRVRRQFGDDVLCVSYSDDFQSYVQRKAFETDGGGEDLAERSADLAKALGKQMADSLASADIQYDMFMHSGSSPSLIPALQHFFSAAQSQDMLFISPQKAPYSDKHQVWGYEAFARGTCPNCGASTDTSQCETCAFPPSISDMEDLRFVLDGSPFRMIETDQILLRVGANRALLQDLFDRMNCRQPLGAFGDEILRKLPEDWAVSRPGDWGPELPDYPGQSLHTWFAGIAGYMAASMDWAAATGNAEAWKDYWNDQNTGIVHFVGIDCAFSHAVVYPIMLSCVEHGPKTKQIYTNQFLTLNGDGFSTSRGHAIWAGEFFSTVDTDAARLYLALVAPELEEADFDLTDFENFTNEVCGKILANAISMVVNTDATRVASGNGLTSELAMIKLDEIRRNYMAAASVEEFSMRGIASCIHDLLTLIHLSAVESLPQLLALYGCLSAPLQPGFSKRLRQALSVDAEWANAWLQEGRILSPTPMFPDDVSALNQVQIPRVEKSARLEFEEEIQKSKPADVANALTAAE